MRDRPVTKRSVAAAVLLAQLLVSVIAPVSHAAAEGASVAHGVHLQAAGTPVCVRHTDLSCPSCRLQVSPMPAGRELLLSGAAETSQNHSWLYEPPAPRVHTAPCGSRAPPVR